MNDWMKNGEWVFSGIGVFVIGIIISIIRWHLRNTKKKPIPPNNLTTVTVNNNVSNGGLVLEAQSLNPLPPDVQQENRSNYADRSISKSALLHQRTRILFVDDDTKFQVVRILRNAGWSHVKIVKDVQSLESPDVLEADILFIDIQGVGQALKFKDEGLGLTMALKKKHPSKKVIIYSAQTTGERFHVALKNADSSLAKNADPYEFLSLVEKFASDIYE